MNSRGFAHLLVVSLMALVTILFNRIGYGEESQPSSFISPQSEKHDTALQASRTAMSAPPALKHSPLYSSSSPSREGYFTTTDPNYTLYRIEAYVEASTDYHVFLPLVVRPPHVTLEHGAASTRACDPITPGTTFDYGVKYLCAEFTVEGAQGHTWRTEWTFNGKHQPDLDRTGMVSSQSYRHIVFICYGPSGTCGEALPRGSYQVRYFLNNQLYVQGTVIIQ